MKQKIAMFEKITNWINSKVGVDGLLHILACKLIVDVCQLFVPIWIAVLVAVVFALYKEFINDKLMKKGTYSVKDLICNAVGILLGLI